MSACLETNHVPYPGTHWLCGNYVSCLKCHPCRGPRTVADGYPYAFGMLHAAVELAITDLLDYPMLEKCSRSEIAARLRDALARADITVNRKP